MAKGNAASAEAKAAKAQAEVDGYVHAAVLRAATENGPLKLQPAKGKDDGLFPAAPPKPVKAAIAAATTGEEPLFRSAGGAGKTEVFALTPAGVRAVGKAIEHTAQSKPVADAIREAEQVLEKLPDTAVELVPLIERLTARQQEEAEREAQQRKTDAERRERVLEAMTRYQTVMAQQKQARIAALQRELAELGGSTTTADPTTTTRPVPTPAPKDAKEFVRQEARRLVSAWADAIRLGKPDAQLALEVVLGNLSAMEQISEEGEETAFDPIHHECDSTVSSGANVTVLRSGWRLIEEGGAEYVVAKAKVKSGG